MLHVSLVQWMCVVSDGVHHGKPPRMLSAKRFLTRRLPPITILMEARVHVSHEVLGRSRKLEFMVVAQAPTKTSRADPNAHQDKGHQENYTERDDHSIHVGTQKEG
jgi:hypothetical protein